MKQILKNKSIIVALVILFSFTLTTEAAFERREDRLKSLEQRNNDAYNPNGEGIEVGQNGSIEDDIPLFWGLSLVYGVCVFKKRRENEVK